MSESDALRRLVAERTTPQAMERVRARLDAARPVGPLLRQLPGPRVGAAARVRARLASPRPRPSWAGGLALAAAALLALGTAKLPPTPLQMDLASAGSTHATDTLTLEWQGQGSVSGDELQPVVDWQRGLLHLELDPEAGVTLQVRTREATVAVLGTVFDVERDVLGTQVSVTRGKVLVECVRGEQPVLVAGQQHTCLPVSAVTWAQRVQALRGQVGGPAQSAQLHAELEQALALPDAQGAARSELLALRLELNAQEQDWPAVRQDALAYLELGGPRQIEIRSLAAQLAQQAGDCDQARALLAGVDKPSEREQAVLSVCGG